jgi:hypothetical protein
MEKLFATKQTQESYHHYPVVDPIHERVPARCFCKYKNVSILKDAKDFEFIDPNGKFGWGYTSSWNGSYHEASWYPHLYAWSKGKKKFQRANKMMQTALSWYKEQSTKDPVTAKFEARNQVRPGD